MHVHDLKVRSDLLRQTATSLGQLRSEFDGLDGRREQFRDSWGSDDVADAMHDFVGNWNDNRRRITENMTSLRRMAEATVEEFGRVEAELSGAFDR